MALSCQEVKLICTGHLFVITIEMEVRKMSNVMMLLIPGSLAAITMLLFYCYKAVYLDRN
jgi:hypothetical protein